MKQFFAVCLALFTSTVGYAQSFEGLVVDKLGNPVPNVLISQGNAVIGQSDADGTFLLDCPSGSVTFSSIGFTKTELSNANCNQKTTVVLQTSEVIKVVDVFGRYADPQIDLPQQQNRSVVNRSDLQEQTGLFLEESMNRTPGVRVEKRTMAGGQRITIRGYGNTQRFNGYGYRAYLNGIPVTDAEGVTTLDDIDPSLLQNITVIKGPAATRYGNGIAGAVLMESLQPSQNGARISQEGLVGSYGLWRSNTRFENRDENSSIILNYGHQNYDSYRVHSASKKDYLSLFGNVNYAANRSISYYFGYANSQDQLAGQLDSTQFYNRENVGEDRYLGNDGRVNYEGYRAGLSHAVQFGSLKNNTSVFFSNIDLEQAYAVGLNRNTTTGAGARTVFDWTNNDGTLIGSFGAELQFNNAYRKTYRYMDHVILGTNSDIEFSGANAMAFTEWTYQFAPTWSITGGLSMTSVKYDITDRLTYVAGHVDGSGNLTFPAQLSPRISLLKEVSDALNFQLSYSRGFSAPTSSHIVIGQTGEVNKDLVPEVGNQVEFHLFGSANDNRLRYDLNVYALMIKDKITTEAIADSTGSVIYTRSTNAGGQNNYGVELALDYAIIRGSESFLKNLNLAANYSYSNHTYDGFMSDANNNAATEDYSGNAVSGVPPHLANIMLNGEFAGGFYANIGWQYVDEMPITFDNEHYAPSYNLLNAKVGYKQVFGRFALDAYVGGQNLTNDLYYNMIVLNQSFSGTAAPKVYLPGVTSSSFYGGLKLSYKL